MSKQLMFCLVWILTLAGGWMGCGHTSPTTAPSPQREVASLFLTAPWAYDPGPSPQTKMGRELIDLVSQQPFMPGISQEITGEQKFRPSFGPTLWRMIQEPNSVKILFIGQDGTHIAEAAGRTATAGFGGRAQDLAAYFGVRTGAAFMNTFAFTIRGQYSAFQTPIISDENGVKKVSLGSVVENGVWMFSQDPNSPMVKWRNGLIDWILRNNKDSLKMIVLFGGSAQDSIGTFIESHGGHVGTRYTEEEMVAHKIKVPLFQLKPAGGNNEFPVVLDNLGNDVYAKILGRKLDYSKPANITAAQAALSKNINKVFPELAISNSGVAESGLSSVAQINGYNLNKISINGQSTLSLKGLRLSDGSEVRSDVLIAEFPHPTALSLMAPEEASKKIATSLKQLDPYVKAGWKIDPDKGMANQFSAGQAYAYGRTDIGPAYYDFGTPKNRMVSVSSASRMSGKSNVIVIGTRDKVQFDVSALTSATKAPRPDGIPEGEMFTARPRLPETRYLFDQGPGSYMAKIMKENLDMTWIGAAKPGMDPKVNGIAAYNIKTHPVEVGDFGHYRGFFTNALVVILADPDGVDDILTSRALTGARGQYLQGLMNDLHLQDQYLVLKTVPFGMDGATDQEWNTVLEQTSRYRKAIFAEILRNNRPLLFLADGKYASQEIESLVGVVPPAPVVKIQRNGSDNNSGLAEAALEIGKIHMFKDIQFHNAMAVLPRSHLGFMARVWEGTSGTHVFDAISAADKGRAFAIVAPEWAFKQIPVQSADERQGVQSLKQILENKKLMRPELKSERQILKTDDSGLWEMCWELRVA